LALIVARLIDPAAKLATTRALDPTTAIHSPRGDAQLGAVSAKEVYATLDWLGAAQGAMEESLARHHLNDGTLVLHVEGRCCELARFGHPGNGRRDKMQIVFPFDGPMCSSARCAGSASTTPCLPRPPAAPSASSCSNRRAGARHRPPHPHRHGVGLSGGRRNGDAPPSDIHVKDR
jgi:hypothetical protein